MVGTLLMIMPVSDLLSPLFIGVSLSISALMMATAFIGSTPYDRDFAVGLDVDTRAGHLGLLQRLVYMVVNGCISNYNQAVMNKDTKGVAVLHIKITNQLKTFIPVGRANV